MAKRRPQHEVVKEEATKGFSVEIDVNALDKEWLRQPVLYHTHAVKLAEARMEEDNAKRALDVTASDLEKEIREDPAEYDITKATESEIKACIIRQPEHRAAVRKMQNAKYAVALHAAAVGALDQRRKALEKLVDLWVRDYFATPKVGEETAEIKARKDKKKARRKAKIRE